MGFGEDLCSGIEWMAEFKDWWTSRECMMVCDEARVVASLLLTKKDFCEEFVSEADEGEKKDSDCQRVCLCMMKGGGTGN